jgi:hypothetical protein
VTPAEKRARATDLRVQATLLEAEARQLEADARTEEPYPPEGRTLGVMARARREG